MPQDQQSMLATTGTSVTGTTVKDPRSICYIREMYRYDFMQAANENGTVGGTVFDPTGGFKGVPEVILINLGLSIVAIILFAALRKRFWDYGRIAVGLFTPGDPVLGNNYDVFAHVHIRPDEETTIKKSNLYEGSQEKKDVGLFTWLYLWAEITDEEILVKCGPSAIQYLQFQNCILFYLSVVTQFCLIFLLPLNMSGDIFHGRGQAFATTTIANLKPNDPKLFVHSVVAVGLFVYFLYSLRFFARAIHVPSHWRHYKHGMPSIPPKTTIMITCLPPKLGTNEVLIRKYFTEAFPECPVAKVQFAYDVNLLRQRVLELREAEIALRAVNRAKVDEVIPARHCRLLNYFKRCNYKKVWAKEFYKSEVERLEKERDKELKAAKQRPLPICFVSFEKKEHAEKVANDFRRLSRLFSVFDSRAVSDLKTSVDDQLFPLKWKVVTAPMATDIAWENLSVRHKRRIRIALNLGGFLILLFISTPSVGIKVYLDMIQDKPLESLGFLEGVILRKLLPTIVHLTLMSLLPYVIEFVEEFSYHEIKSVREMTIMLKTTFYQIVMILLLPSLGLASVGLPVAKKIFPSSQVLGDNLELQWQCWLLPDQPAFFVNFMLVEAMLGTALALMRLSNIIYYIYRICGSRSRFEMEHVRTVSIYNFPYGYNYAFYLTMFAIIMAYCIACPIIAPCGFLFFALRYQVDRYNLYFAFNAHYVQPQMHRRAANILVGCCIFAQLSLIVFTIVSHTVADDNKYGTGYVIMLRTVFMLLGFAVSLALLACQLFSGVYFQASQISPFQHCFGETDTCSGSGSSTTFGLADSASTASTYRFG